MARTSHATEIHDTSQKSGRNPSAGQPSYIVIHHAATLDFDAVVRMEMGTKQVSSHCIVKDDRVASMMDESYRAWSLSDAYWDSLSLTVETCNSAGGPAWPISDASYLTLAKIVADWCRRYSIPCTRSRIIGHREVYTQFGGSYATACPGGINLDRVVSLAVGILSGTAGEDVEPLIDYALLRRQKEESMYVKGKTNPQVYNVFTDANGNLRMRACEENEASYATVGGLVVQGGDDVTIVNLGKAAGYVFKQPIPLPVVTVAP